MQETARTLQQPGQGIVHETEPVTRHVEYPKHMIHPGYQPASKGVEIKSPHGFSYWKGGTAQRFPPVLVNDENQEEFYVSQGYQSIGKSDARAFLAAVNVAEPIGEAYTASEYPKWIPALNRAVASPEEEADALGLSMSEMAAVAASAPPSLAAEIVPNIAPSGVAPSDVTPSNVVPMPRITAPGRLEQVEAGLAALDTKLNAGLTRANESIDRLAVLLGRFLDPVSPPEAPVSPPEAPAVEAPAMEAPAAASIAIETSVESTAVPEPAVPEPVVPEPAVPESTVPLTADSSRRRRRVLSDANAKPDTNAKPDWLTSA
jgi:hypothetical protein